MTCGRNKLPRDKEEARKIWDKEENLISPPLCYSFTVHNCAYQTCYSELLESIPSLQQRPGNTLDTGFIFLSWLSTGGSSCGGIKQAVRSLQNFIWSGALQLYKPVQLCYADHLETALWLLQYLLLLPGAKLLILSWAALKVDSWGCRGRASLCLNSLCVTAEGLGTILPLCNQLLASPVPLWGPCSRAAAPLLPTGMTLLQPTLAAESCLQPESSTQWLWVVLKRARVKKWEITLCSFPSYHSLRIQSVFPLVGHLVTLFRDYLQSKSQQWRKENAEGVGRRKG